MKKQKILFSIIVPVYNTELYVSRCIDSILNQTYSNFELIIINDGSTDNSENIIKKYNDNRIKLFSRKNKGALYTRIEGINKSIGDYIVFVDSDDCLIKNSLEIYYNEIKDNNYDIIRGNYKIFTESKIKNIIDFKKETIINKSNKEKQLINTMAKTNKFNSLWRQAIKKNIIDTKNLDNNIFMGEDMDFNYQLYKKANKIKLITNPLYMYRINNQSITNIKDINKIKRNTEDVLTVLEKIIKDVKNNYSSDTLNSWYIRYIKQVNHSLYRIIKYSERIDIEYIKEIFNNIQLNEIRNKLNKKYLYNLEYIFLIKIYKNNLETYLKIMKIFAKLL